jgi:hypothetical protein
VAQEEVVEDLHKERRRRRGRRMMAMPSHINTNPIYCNFRYTHTTTQDVTVVMVWRVFRLAPPTPRVVQ